MYIVTSKPKRISVNSGLVHIVFSRKDMGYDLRLRSMALAAIASREPVACPRATCTGPNTKPIDRTLTYCLRPPSGTHTAISAIAAHDFHEIVTRKQGLLCAYQLGPPAAEN